MDKKVSEEALLSEYNALRNEVLAMFNRNNTILNLTWAGISLTTGIAFYQKHPLLNLFSVALAFWSWIEIIRVRNAVAKIGAYVSISLEPQLGLKWEQLRNIEDNTWTNLSRFSLLIKAIITKNSFTILLSYFLLLLLFAIYPKYDYQTLLFRWGAICISNILIFWGIILSMKSRNYRKVWIEYFEKMAKE